MHFNLSPLLQRKIYGREFIRGSIGISLILQMIIIFSFGWVQASRPWRHTGSTARSSRFSFVRHSISGDERARFRRSCRSCRYPSSNCRTSKLLQTVYHVSS